MSSGNMKYIVKCVAVMGVVGLVATACGSSSTKASSGTTTPSVRPTTAASSSSGGAASGSPIVIGNIGSYTGANDENGVGSGQVVNAWASWVNANGGLNGHPVKVIVKDDAGSPSQALQDANQLVADHVLAVVGEESIIPTAWTSVLDKAGIPLIGGLPSDTFNYTDTNAFPVGGSNLAQFAGQFEYMKSVGLHKFAMLYCAEAPGCATAGAKSKAVAMVVGGITVSYVGAVAATEPTYTSQCLAMKSAGVQAFQVVSVSEVPIRVAEACAQLGVTPLPVNAATESDAAWLAIPALNNGVLFSPVANYLDSSVPGVAQFLKVGSQYIPGLVKNPQFGLAALLGWAAAQVFQTAAKAGNIGPTSTSQELKAALYTVKNFTADGVMSPVTYIEGQPTFITCNFTYKQSNGNYKPLNNDHDTCLSQAIVTGLRQLVTTAG